MQFSDSNTNQGLIEDISFWLGIDENAFPREDRTRSLNERYRMAWAIIFEAHGNWQFMDDNTSDTTTGVPHADQNLTSGTSLYALPSASLVINAVQIKDSVGNWLDPLTGITQEQFTIAGGELYWTTSNTPTHFMLQGDVLRLLPTPNYTLSNGIRVFFDQGISTFATTDTTKTPGFASPFHRILSIGASLDYAIARNLSEKRATLQNLWNDYEVRLRDFYAKRFKTQLSSDINPGFDLMDDLT